MNDYNFMKKTNHVLSGDFPFAKTLEVGANHEALDLERHEKMVKAHAGRSKTGQ